MLNNDQPTHDPFAPDAAEGQDITTGKAPLGQTAGETPKPDSVAVAEEDESSESDPIIEETQQPEPEPAPEPVYDIVVENFRHEYGDFVAVQNMSVKIPRGTITGFIGPNGAGKTTTIQLLATLLKPTRGEAWIAGAHCLKQRAQVRRLMGYMPDSFGVYEGLTTLEYLQFFADLFKLPKATRKETIDDVVQLLNLEPKLGTPVEGLSRGQRQRLSLARTLLHNPQVLILDEPASGLDPLARMEFLYILRELRNLGKTLLISSHILSEVSEICDLLMIMTEGEVVAFGSMEEICQRVRPHYAIELELLEDQTQVAIDYLKTQGVTEFNATDRLLEFDFVGEREELMEIHRGLVMNNIPLLYFRPLELTLEQAFAELTTMPAKQATSAISSVHPVMDEVYEAFTDDSVEKEAQESGDTSNVDEESYKLATGGFTAPRA